MVTELKIAQLRLGTPCLKVLPLIDLSIYNPNLPVENAYLEIVPPNFERKFQVPYAPGNVTLVSTVSLGLTHKPDIMYSGLYTITQTIKPNDKLVNTQYVFNTAQERHRLIDLASSLMQECKNLDDVYEIHSGLDIVEMLATEGECKKAITLFNQLCEKLEALCVDCANR